MSENIPQKSYPWLQQFLSVAIPCVMSWAFAFLSIYDFRDYSFGLFIWLPFVLGAVSTAIYIRKNDVPRRAVLNNVWLTLAVFCLGLLLFAWEGIICLVMAAPIGMLSAYLGFLMAYSFRKTAITDKPGPLIIILLLSVPSLMAFENNSDDKEDLRSVTTSVEIDASPETVWKNVVSFPQLKEPDEFIFKTGIAYPINATINGDTVGAVRYCNFSTGHFKEPITVWDEPKLLKFSVDEQPEPMKELSFYDIHPNHLHGYWVSKEGQFKLTALPNGHTLLEGTTRYVNKIRPQFYWTLWSDYIVHKIHTRVLQHIKEQAEKK